MDIEQAHVLVIDDNPQARRLVATALGAVVARVHEASDAIAGLAAWLQVRPHLVFVDYHMPQLDGATFVRILRAQEAIVGSRTVTLMVTAHSDRGHVVAALEAGADGFIVKPLEADAIIGRAVQALSALPAGRSSRESQVLP